MHLLCKLWLGAVWKEKYFINDLLKPLNMLETAQRDHKFVSVLKFK